MVRAEMDAREAGRRANLFGGTHCVTGIERNFGHAGAQVYLVGEIGRRLGARGGQHAVIGRQGRFGLARSRKNVSQIGAQVSLDLRICQKGAGESHLLFHIAFGLGVSQQDEAIRFRL